MKKLILIFSIIFISTNLLAYNWTDLGVTSNSVEQDQNEQDQKNIAELKDESGNVFYVNNEDQVTDETAKRIVELKNRFYAFKIIEIDKLKFLVKGNEIQISLIPSSFNYDEKDVMSNVTAGLLFTFRDQVLRYNFRIVTKNMFLKMEGVYLDEELLCKKIVEAIEDPAAFLQRRDPDYILARIDKLEEKIDVLTVDLKNTKKSLVAAVMAYQNDRFFAGEKPVNKELIEAVVEIKTSSPTYSQEQVEQELEKRELKYTKKALKIILQVYYNEFGK